MSMKHGRKLLRPLVGSGLILTGLAVTAAPASAAHVPGCGSVITTSTTLQTDIGPCSGDGLIVMGSNINLNLNGNRVYGNNGAGDNVGIRVVPTPPPPGSPPGTPPSFPTGNVVRNGIVEGFDGGVAIFGGGGNTVTKITARNNINDLNIGDDEDDECEVGDGIAVTDSSKNTISNNKAIHNGPFAGIAVIGNSDGNVIRNNLAKDNNVQGPGCGNPFQDEGIRIEGPGADDNVVENNKVVNSLLAGIGLHGYVCAGGEEEPNQGTIVRGNTISLTAGDDGGSDGIAFLQQGPAGIVCPAFNATVTGNTSKNNEGDGIFVAGNSGFNTISSNSVLRNGGSGIFLNGPATRNVFTNVGPSLLDVVTPERAPFTEGTEYLVLSGSGSGDVTSDVVPIDVSFTNVGGINTNPVNTSTSGCEQADYDAAGFQAGDVALIQRGTCTFQAKLDLAVANGASAVILFNEGQTGRTSADFGSVSALGIPAVTTTFAVGAELTNLARAGTVTIQVVTNTTNETQEVAPGANNNTLVRNNGRDNVDFDGADLNVNPPCDNNEWINNDFGTVNQPCVDVDARVPALLPAGRQSGPTSRGDVEGVTRGSAEVSNS